MRRPLRAARLRDGPGRRMLCVVRMVVVVSATLVVVVTCVDVTCVVLEHA